MPILLHTSQMFPNDILVLVTPCALKLHIFCGILVVDVVFIIEEAGELIIIKKPYFFYFPTN